MAVSFQRLGPQVSVRFNTSTQNLRFRLSAHVLDAPMDPGERDLGVVGLFFLSFFHYS